MQTHTRLLVALVAAGIAGRAPRAAAQTLSLGVIGGGSLTGASRDVTLGSDPFVTRTWSPSKDWMAGGMLELRLRPRFSLEVDGIYRLLHITWAAVWQDGALNSVSPSPVVTWEFPVLAKYRFPAGRAKPFVEVGPSFRTTGNLNFTPSHVGASAGLGVETRWRGVDIAPVVRYTRWAPDLHRYADSAPTQLNQLELMVGLSHPADSLWSPAGTRLSVGAVAGWGLNPDLPGSYTAVVSGFPYGTTTYSGGGITSLVAGPSVEIHLYPRWSVEVDALHKPLRTHTNLTFGNGAPSQSYTATSAATWQFPLLAKYHFRGAKVDPFVEAGPSFRLPQWNLSTHGATAGGGVAFHLRVLRLSPAVRFTHWGPDSGIGLSGVARNEASVVLGVSFGGYDGK